MYIRLIKGGEKGIIEPFFDGGEAYRDYHKYVTLNNYKVEPEGAARQIRTNRLNGTTNISETIPKTQS